jgi:TPR repeat protein
MLIYFENEMKNKIFLYLFHITLTVNSSTLLAGEIEEADEALVQKRYIEALIKFKIAADKNNSYAQLQIGNIYNEGLNVKKDYVEAMRWYKLSAAQGNASAQFNIGTMYEFGEGVKQNFATAINWYKLAAAQGNLDAQNNLGLMYGKGLGVLQDSTRSYLWFSVATLRGDKEAQKNRDVVASKMTTEQIVEAQRLAKECLAKNFKNCD